MAKADTKKSPTHLNDPLESAKLTPNMPPDAVVPENNPPTTIECMGKCGRTISSDQQPIGVEGWGCNQPGCPTHLPDTAKVITPPPPPPVAVKKWKVLRSTTVSINGQITTLPADSIVSAEDYGEAGMRAILTSNVPLKVHE